MKYRVASDISNSLPFRVFTNVEDGQLARSVCVLIDPYLSFSYLLHCIRIHV